MPHITRLTSHFRVCCGACRAHHMRRAGELVIGAQAHEVPAQRGKRRHCPRAGGAHLCRQPQLPQARLHLHAKLGIGSQSRITI